MDFKVPMKELHVEVAMTQADPTPYVLFLSPFSDQHGGSETLNEYLNSGRRFFPMSNEGAPKIVNRDQILWIRGVKDDFPISVSEGTKIHRLAILEMTDGSRLEGFLIIDRPVEYSRISDLLNDAKEAFIRVDDEEWTYYINKTFVRAAIPR